MLEKLKLKIFFWRQKKKLTALHDLFYYYTLILVIWGFYRLLFRFPTWLEEGLLKPLVFVLPVWWRIRKEKGTWKERLASLGITTKNIFAGLSFGLALGVFYMFVGRMGRVFRFGGPLSNPYGTMPEAPLEMVVLAFLTALWEELAFVGYLLPRFERWWKDEWRSATVTALLFGLIHVPILVFGYRFPVSIVVGQFLLTFILGFGNCVLMLRLKNLVAPVMSHMLWGVAVLLFR